MEYLGTTSLSFSPGIIASSLLTWKPVKGLSFSLVSKYTGKQYMDNTGNESRALKGYFVNNFSAGYSFRLKPFREIGINFLVNNLFNVKYESNAWVYQYYFNREHFEESGYFPQALVNFLVGLTIRI
jgi:iron complex outermembrane receptor protein